MKLEFQYSVKLWLFDDLNIIQLIIMLQLQHYTNNFQWTS